MHSCVVVIAKMEALYYSSPRFTSCIGFYYYPVFSLTLTPYSGVRGIAVVGDLTPKLSPYILEAETLDLHEMGGKKKENLLRRKAMRCAVVIAKM